MTATNTTCQQDVCTGLGVDQVSGLRADHVVAEAAEPRASMSVDAPLPTQKRRLVDNSFFQAFKENYLDCLGDIRHGISPQHSASDRLFRLCFVDIPEQGKNPSVVSTKKKQFLLYNRGTVGDPLISGLVTSRGVGWGSGDFFIHDIRNPAVSAEPGRFTNIFVALILTFTARLRLKSQGELVGQHRPYAFCVHFEDNIKDLVTLPCKVHDRSYCVVRDDCTFMDLPYGQLFVPSWFSW